jgi:DNA replicative helicase MCM subunit Mcm2 (Cdc46/Mcm family)
MINLPDKLSAAYNSFMAQKGIPANQQTYFRKWLRYYIDFCRKYRHDYDEKSSLAAFLTKRKEKQHRKQAQGAIELYYRMLERRERLLLLCAKFSLQLIMQRPTRN